MTSATALCPGRQIVTLLSGDGQAKVHLWFLQFLFAKALRHELLDVCDREAHATTSLPPLLVVCAHSEVTNFYPLSSVEGLLHLQLVCSNDATYAGVCVFDVAGQPQLWGRWSWSTSERHGTKESRSRARTCGSRFTKVDSAGFRRWTESSQETTE